MAEKINIKKGETNNNARNTLKVPTSNNFNTWVSILTVKSNNSINFN